MKKEGHYNTNLNFIMLKFHETGIITIFTLLKTYFFFSFSLTNLNFKNSVVVFVFVLLGTEPRTFALSYIFRLFSCFFVNLFKHGLTKLPGCPALA